MSEPLGFCEHMIASQATCKACAIKMEKRIAELESILRKIADWNGMWGPYPETNKDWATMAVMAAREAIPEPPQEGNER